jgi:hypothetical protein
MKPPKTFPRPAHEYDRFPSGESYTLFQQSFDWCYEDSLRHDQPVTEWVIPVSVINGWNRGRAAKALTDANIWKRDTYQHVYVFVYVTPGCEPKTLFDARQYRREQKRRQRHKPIQQPPEAGFECQVSPGDTPGDTSPKHPPNRAGVVQNKPPLSSDDPEMSHGDNDAPL